MRHLIPDLIFKKFERGARGGRLQAATMFVDISGFTSLTETLMQQRKDGAEVLTDALNRVFGPIVRQVYAHGGLITTFAGDAFTALFPLRRDAARAALYAAQTACFIQQFFAQHGCLQTRYGEFALGVKVGLGVGAVEWGIVGQATRRAYFFRGPAIDACAGAEHAAEAGDIVVTPELAQRLGAHFSTEAAGACLRLAGAAPDLPPKRIRLPALTRDSVSAFVPDTVVALSAPAEFRDVACAFISFDALPDAAALEAFVGQVLEGAARYGGYFNKLDFGDKGPVMLVLFGAPAAHENDLERAADFLLALQAASPVESRSFPRWRAGLTYGTVYAGLVGGAERCEYTAIGDVVNLAARLMMQADWGQIFASGAAAQNKALVVEPVGNLLYKGFAEPMPTYHLVGRKTGEETFFEHALVGRQAELEQLIAAAQPIFEGRFAGVAYIYGEPGLGKSHLLYELRRALQRRVALTCLTAQTDQILRQAFNPFSYFLRRYFDQAAEAAPDENKARFEARLERLLGDLSGLPDPAGLRDELVRTQSVLGALVGLHWPGSLYESLDGNLRYQNTLFAIKALLLAASRLRPVLLEVEDLQWLDEASHEALATLSRNIADYPLFVVVTSRYADDGGKPALKLADDVPSASIDLGALSRADLRQLAESILGGPAADGLLDLLLERTQANPFFAQQFLYYFQENDLLETRALEAGMVWAVKDAIPADVPTTINAILIARIDRLAQDVKEVVKAAAVLGREFDDRILTRMLEADISTQVHAAEQEQVWSRVS